MKYTPKQNLGMLKTFSTSFHKDVAKVADVVLDNPKFLTWSASSHSVAHHYGHGGLIQHTREVVDLCVNNAHLTGADIDVVELYLAALFHDYGKIWDYQCISEQDDVWTGTDHKRRIHHISRSGVEWSKAVTGTSLEEKYHDPVLHAILAHHGQREWGSPVFPKSKTAWLLHLCDGISARMDDADTLDILKREKT